MLVSHGVGGVERQEQVRVGSVVESLLQEAPCPVFLVSAVPEPGETAEAAPLPEPIATG